MRKVLYIMGQLNDEDIEWMAQAGRRRELAGGDIIIREGVEVSDLFIVLAGAVEVAVSGVGVVARLASGEIIGEMSFVDRAPPSATVRAAERAIVLALDKRMMEARLVTDMGFSARFYKALAIYLSDRLRDTMNRKSGESLDSKDIQEDELDEMVLDQVSLAGTRFQYMLKTLMSARLA
jgi:CRP/FNR family transcriptional regulator, cyclic AMP receptor protein